MTEQHTLLKKLLLFSLATYADVDYNIISSIIVSSLVL